MIKIKNVQEGPRGIIAEGLVAMLLPGETRDLNVTPEDIRAARKTGWFEFEGAEEEEEPTPDAELDKLSDDELRAYLAARNVATDSRWQRKRLLVEAEKVKAAA